MEKQAQKSKRHRYANQVIIVAMYESNYRFLLQRSTSMKSAQALAPQV